MLFFVLFLLMITGFIVIYFVLSSNKEETIKIDYKKTDIYNELNNISIKNKDILLLKNKISEYIIGMDNLLNSIIVSIIADGHILIEGFPGLAKTRTILVFSKLLGLDFKRIQFTPDMLPSDIIGGEIYNKNSGKFELFKGPIFTNLLLADEINRATPKVQSALLEAMQEKKVTIGNQTFQLKKPFFVMATENPIEQEGTFPLPEAQLDRFLFKINVFYPNKEIEKEIISSFNKDLSELDPIFSDQDIVNIQENIKYIEVPDRVKDYVVDVIDELRKTDEYIVLGPSPRGTIALIQAAKVVAFLEDRNSINIDDVKKVILPVLRHRIKLSYKAISENKSPEELIISKVVNVYDF